MLSAVISSAHSYPAMRLASQPVHQGCVHSGPLVLGAGPLKLPAPTADRDQTVSRRFKPSSRTTLNGEQPYPWDRLQPQDVMSRHRGAKLRRRCELLGGISLLSPEYLLSVERWPFHSEPVSVKISDFYSRAASGGVGSAKAAGNYAASFYPTKLAAEEGYEQIIWTDDATHKYFEESGTMNVFVRIKDTIYTPPTSEKILDGVTRDSFLQLAKHKGIDVKVEPVEVAKVLEAHSKGELIEVWGNCIVN